MKLSLTSWSLRACSLQEAVGLSKVLGIGALDLGYFYGPALSRDAILEDPDGEAHRVRDLGIPVPCFYHLFGDSLAGRNMADRSQHSGNWADFRVICRFMKAAGIPTVFVLPGVVNPGQSRQDALAVSADGLAELVKIGSGVGVTVTIEPHVHSYLESPSLVLDLLDRVPGLKLTLDYAHFACLGYRQEEVDVLAPHAAHVHLRQARPGALQTKGAEGTINMEAQFATLRDAGFDGYLALEYVHQDYMDTLYDDVLTETIGLRDKFRAWSKG
ncbi:MAG: sugar phosphate isomerase/epimerase family protein [Pseudomonadota bacterium]